MRRNLQKWPLATVGQVAKAVKCSPYIVRALADRGLLSVVRDYNGWRRFPNLEQSIQEMQNILHPDPESTANDH